MIILGPRKSLNDSFVRLPRTWFALGFTVPNTLRIERMCLNGNSLSINLMSFHNEAHIKKS